MIEVVVLLKTDEYFSELWVVFSNFQKKKREYSIYFVFLSRAMTRLAYRLKRVGIVSARDSTSERTRIHFQKKKKKKPKKKRGNGNREAAAIGVWIFQAPGTCRPHTPQPNDTSRVARRPTATWPSTQQRNATHPPPSQATRRVSSARARGAKHQKKKKNSSPRADHRFARSFASSSLLPLPPSPRRLRRRAPPTPSPLPPSRRPELKLGFPPPEPALPPSPPPARPPAFPLARSRAASGSPRAPIRRWPPRNPRVSPWRR